MRSRHDAFGVSIMAALLAANDGLVHGGFPLQSMSAGRRRKYIHDAMSGKKFNRSSHRPHQGDGECERRRRQIASGQLKVSNGLAVA